MKHTDWFKYYYWFCGKQHQICNRGGSH